MLYSNFAIYAPTPDDGLRGVRKYLGTIQIQKIY